VSLIRREPHSGIRQAFGLPNPLDLVLRLARVPRAARHPTLSAMA